MLWLREGRMAVGQRGEGSSREFHGQPREGVWIQGSWHVQVATAGGRGLQTTAAGGWKLMSDQEKGGTDSVRMPGAGSSSRRGGNDDGSIQGTHAGNGVEGVASSREREKRGGGHKEGRQGMEGMASSKGQLRQRCHREGGWESGMGRLRVDRA